MRKQRVQAIRTALKSVTSGLDIELVRRATALITHPCSATSGVSIADESGLVTPMPGRLLAGASMRSSACCKERRVIPAVPGFA
jgi:hypothetical protein